MNSCHCVGTWQNPKHLLWALAIIVAIPIAWWLIGFAIGFVSVFVNYFKKGGCL